MKSLKFASLVLGSFLILSAQSSYAGSSSYNFIPSSSGGKYTRVLEETPESSGPYISILVPGTLNGVYAQMNVINPGSDAVLNALINQPMSSISAVTLICTAPPSSGNTFEVGSGQTCYVNQIRFAN